MGRKVIKKGLSGVTSDAVRDYEVASRRVARKAAADGMVLLKNAGALLPLDIHKPVALYGAGAVMTIKGGTGSGDVNSRPTVSIWEGMLNAGFRLTTRDWLTEYEQEYHKARIAWRDLLWKITVGGGEFDFFDAYASHPFEVPAGRIPEARAKDDTADTAIYVLSRTAGEGSDRKNRAGDYQLTGEEHDLLLALCGLYEHVVLVLNTGGLVELGFTDEPAMANIDAILYIHQPGMEAGNAVADIISGAVSPSAKLTDSWAMAYEDYPNAGTFSHMNGNVSREEYVEGLYVGYRYFDTFEKPVRYGFGYGLSYTEFQIAAEGITHYRLGTAHPEIGVGVSVKNTGGTAGREVVQIYASAPQGEGAGGSGTNGTDVDGSGTVCGMEKEYRRLVGYAKTAMLAPGESGTLDIRFPLYAMASYDEALPGWKLEAGSYVLMAGASLAASEPVGVVRVEQELIFSRTEHICTPKEKVEELKQSAPVAASIQARRAALLEKVKKERLPVLSVHEGDVVAESITYDGAYEDTPQEVRDFVETLSTEQLIKLATGDVAKGQDMNEETQEGESQLGDAGTSVPGSAAQTSDCAAAQGLADIVLADGPAGLRLSSTYQVVDGRPVRMPFLASLEGRFLLKEKDRVTQGETYYQYCTAFPVGTQLAQSWDRDLIAEVGAAVGKELVEFNVTLWLAPGMNIHRNPLCGRNFEYYSEDPLVAGCCAAAMTEGVQSVQGVGTTIKHFACNNQEDNRMGSDSVLSERVLREIYLKGFEIAVKQAQPMSIMTSYNLVNGVHAANNYDLCTKAARNEWGFKGVIMTDWTTTLKDETCTASGCMRAGNDLVMPGAPLDHDNLRAELEAGTLSIRDLKRSVARLVNIVWQSRFTAE